MNLGILNNTVILIDTDFLNERISHNLTIYKGLYPNKTFKEINLPNLLYNFALNARIEEGGRYVDIIFAHTPVNSILTHCVPSNLFFDITSDGVQLETEIGTFLVRSFFSDEDETCIEHFDIILRSVHNSPEVSRIIVISDNEFLNDQLRYMEYKKEKSILLLRNYYNTQIDNDIDIKFVNINYVIADSLGLKRDEI